MISHPHFSVKPVLVGDRALLRNVCVDDVPRFGLLFTDPNARKLTGDHDSMDVADQLRLYSFAASDSNQLRLAVVDKATDEYCGEIALKNLDRHNRSCWLRIALLDGAVNRGLGSESIRLVLDHAFSVVGLRRVSIEVYDFNHRARHVYERLGFVHEGTLRDAMTWDGIWYSSHIMSVLADEWLANSQVRVNVSKNHG